MKLRYLFFALILILVILKFGFLPPLAVLLASAIVYRITRPIFSFVWKGLTYRGTLRTNPFVDNRLMNFDLKRILN